MLIRRHALCFSQYKVGLWTWRVAQIELFISFDQNNDDEKASSCLRICRNIGKMHDHQSVDSVFYSMEERISGSEKLCCFSWIRKQGCATQTCSSEIKGSSWWPNLLASSDFLMEITWTQKTVSHSTKPLPFHHFPDKKGNGSVVQ